METLPAVSSLSLSLAWLWVQVFMGQYETFKREMEDMEQRLGQIVCLAFDDCSGCESALKVNVHTHPPVYSLFMCVCVCVCVQLLEMMGLLIERPLVHRDFQAKYPVLLSMYSQELDLSKAIFNQQVALNRAQQVHSTPHTDFKVLTDSLSEGTVH